ncbi:nitrate reductase (NADH) [Sporothrix schenckii 1099-18]|uniref:Nitrate reductase [NADPH] n=1 Tax=Sporothrix schenckii 1099-18 TaxID=1397361 RepID=A0A0F2M637_SPOSC|nr:nitrate reductase (NADH) [Sporothrix schenckii 1099-18]KJR84270.1 nitrate reductase (NADH) [Sporothrix schenckii 1099-18]
MAPFNPHPGSSPEAIANEPNWTSRHNHRIGFRNRDGRIPGLSDSYGDYVQEIERSREDLAALEREKKEGQLVDFREVIQRQEDFHLRHPEYRSLGWRYVLNTTEDWMKQQQKWPANASKRQTNEGTQSRGTNESGTTQADEQTTKDDSQDQDSGHADKDTYSPKEQAFLETLLREKQYMSTLQVNDGRRAAPRLANRTTISIDEQDQFTPDNWLPRSSDLIRLTGKHPLNAEPHLSHLFDAGLITPNELHYVRNHGAVPRLLWEFHRLDIACGAKTVSLSMDELKDSYDTINIPVLLACDGNRRKELNQIRKSKGFNWGAGAASCAYWKGPLLRDVLLSSGVLEALPTEDDGQTRHWVNFAGADTPSAGRYETCIPLAYAMDPTNDVLLAYQMNDLFLPPDHGYPVRLIIPGYVGGRCVKWLSKVWITATENRSHYHIWDNRVLPGFVTDMDGAFAKAMFHHPDTLCNEQSLNSVIVKPAHGETVPLAEARKGRTYRVAGYAYGGGGHAVQRVEVSLDGGSTWLYCVRTLPDYPIRHGHKFWTWLHWHVDVDVVQLVGAQSITVRCFDVFKNTQPEKPNWNIMGMMNNCHYVVQAEPVERPDSDMLAVLFRHPVEPGTGDGGWMQPSAENQIAAAQQASAVPEKQFTRDEIEKHGQEDDCWLVVDGRVYDATSVLRWHPGGKAAILAHAGKVHQQTTDEFASIHDDYAYAKLNECALGSVTDKARQFIQQTAEAAAKEQATADEGRPSGLAIQKHRWVPVRLVDRRDISHDTRKYTFQLPDGKDTLGLGTCQHILIGFHMQDRMLVRSYTPTRPLLPALPSGQANTTAKRQANDDDDDDDDDDDTESVRDGHGTFELTVKTYFPDVSQPGGAMSNILDCVPLGEEVEMRGPTGEITYDGHGAFTIEGRARRFARVSLVLGGSGVTPGFALIARILLTSGDETQLRVIDANKAEGDILLRDELDALAKNAASRDQQQMKITHILSHADKAWQGRRGHVDAGLIRETLFAPAEDSVVFLCGPPAMIQNAVLPVLRDWGYTEDENMYGF